MLIERGLSLLAVYSGGRARIFDERKPVWRRGAAHITECITEKLQELIVSDIQVGHGRIICNLVVLVMLCSSVHGKGNSAWSQLLAADDYEENGKTKQWTVTDELLPFKYTGIITDGNGMILATINISRLVNVKAR